MQRTRAEDEYNHLPSGLSSVITWGVFSSSVAAPAYSIEAPLLGHIYGAL